MSRVADKKISIDIQYSKLIEWLIDRKQISSGWQEKIRKIREDINNGLVELPDVPEITDMLKGKYLHYYHCKKIFQLMEDAEGGRTKNIFGQYTSNHLRTWNKILKGYEKDNIFLGEAARILIQNTKYLCPSLKKTIQQSDKQTQDLVRKVQDYRKGITEAKKRFEKTCKDMGIKGKNFKSELLALTNELPALYREIEEDICSATVEEALEYHREFTSFLLGRIESDTTIEPSFEYIREQLSKGVTPLAQISSEAVEVDQDTSGVPNDEDGAIEINWDDIKSGVVDAGISAAPEEINWDVDLPTSADANAEPPSGDEKSWGISIADSGLGEKINSKDEESTVDWDANKPAEIDWDMSIGKDTAPDVKLADITAAPDEINWDITLENASEQLQENTADAINWDISVAEEGAVHSVGQITQATPENIDWGISTATEESLAETKEEDLAQEGKSLLYGERFRENITNDFIELQAFLSHRKTELMDEQNVEYANQFQGASNLLQRQSAETLKTYLQLTDQILSRLTDSRLHQVTMIKHSPQFLDRQIQFLQQKQGRAYKLESMIENAEQKQEEAISLLSKTVPELKGTIEETKYLKEEIEKSIGSILDCKVKIAGEINSL